MNTHYQLIEKEFLAYAKEKNSNAQRFFKSSPGAYAEHDIFINITVPNIRALVKKYNTLTLKDITYFLHSKINEHRLFALFCLVDTFKKGDLLTKKTVYNLYLENIYYINNWNLVDSSAYQIIGAYLADKEKTILYTLSQSDTMWHRRISIISTLYFIKENQYDTTLKIAHILMNDTEDLIHKAVGWMLREVSKKNFKVADDFIQKYNNIMPRTMLRYAIEKYPENIRKSFLKINTR